MTKNNPVYDLRMKHERASSMDPNVLNEDVNKYLETNTPSEYEVSILAGLYDMVAENIERANIRNRTAEEWRALEGQYIHGPENSIFTQPDLEDWYLTKLENGKIDRAEYEAEVGKFKECDHRFCINVFIPKRVKQRFCCADCRKREDASLKQYEFTKAMYANPTYLPVSAYKDVRESEKEKAYRKHERSFDPQVMTEIIVEKESNRGIRDRATEERRNRANDIKKEAENYEKVTGIVQKSVIETPLMVQEKGEGKQAR
ncbi:hypothetical protein ACE8FZ_06675 [Peribacillus frigoritolerans]|uniref:hypothetical protein n=1 Tax=Peribacillus frigoritolerans TaxID=450367 RepID=UPI0035D0F4DD